MSNIAELTKQLRDEIQKQYGVGANIIIGIHQHYNENSHLDRVVSNQIALAISHTYGGVNVEHNSGDGVNWVKIEPPYTEKTSLSIFYKEGA